MDFVHLLLAFVAGFGIGGGLLFVWGTKHGSSLANAAHVAANDLAIAKATASTVSAAVQKVA